MPRGERSSRVKSLLRLALAGTGGLLVRVEALERRMEAMEAFAGNEQQVSPSDHEEDTPPSLGASAMSAMQSMLAGLE